MIPPPPSEVVRAIDAFLDGNADVCMQMLHELQVDGETHPDLHYVAAMCERSRGRLEQAEAAIVAAMAAPDPRPEYRMEHGLVLMQMGRHEEALEQLRQAVTLADGAPEFRAELYLQNASALCQAGYVEAAVLSLQKALRFLPEPRTYLLLGRILLNRQQWSETLNICSEAIRHFPRDGRMHHLQGLALAQGDMLMEAAAAFKQAVALDPEDAFALLNLAYCYENMGRTDRAHELFGQLLDMQLPDELKHQIRQKLS